MTGGRWIDLGDIDAREMHAVPLAIAECLRGGDRPVLLWMRSAQTQMCVGASQDPGAELDLVACRFQGVVTTRRCLGGGTVLVDDGQDSFYLIVHRDRVRAAREILFSVVLAAARSTYRAFGLNPQTVGTGDLWCGQRKIMGSGAASVGEAHLIGASFLYRFDAKAFAALVSAPTSGYRHWLGRALREGMTDWITEGTPPERFELAERFRTDLGRNLGLCFGGSQLGAAELDELPQARVELEQGVDPNGRRQIRHGIKVNHGTFLLEFESTRLILKQGRIQRIRHRNRDLDELQGLVPISAAFDRAARRCLGPVAASPLIGEAREAIRGIP